MSTIRTFRELIVWQKAMEAAIAQAVPAGQSKIAPSFMAGLLWLEGVRPSGTPESGSPHVWESNSGATCHTGSGVPLGRESLSPHNPAMNDGAILKDSAGIQKLRTLLHSAKATFLFACAINPMISCTQIGGEPKSC
jgi:hypothetical protein